ncbi:molybdopterin molybdenumtransferase [Clostridium pasteurianum DSM 525 = ATCC 6013]|uniref:Molybdopterin molybdenumtransferase n=1 Tax=Clostridium pasteurianum DSM 525 = ATCC 6013 TaxID=1262449 RepID=A0A0H3J2W2_CLOPA|nr:gephyrin-like molybdotransferase Glp [Clostridium pasteurianum]AJA47127.1 molybdopterin molybdenumtransferase [Clostridium pasteurianum DSM 525 = ATCC 6013]AJA51115.1 molybdopterin molybdenumtransferase [Clostridium pasteurianum DSM 525 = ATCC 6013]AOZ74488.1 molybdenum cofactor biosynthesis protein [Clostridium pasteurianum DSM 525 = ATCC 6013]AOZ78285.1 molybdenum cofactor biosynthesis protein [Clostridium pasteurianum]ELP59484.1 molybdenum cofactor synthesis domain-containing protein [Cl
MVSTEKALDIILNETCLGGIEDKNILDSLDRVVSEHIYSKDSLPPFNKAAMDGYALRSEDTLEASVDKPIEFNIIGTAKAGGSLEKVLHSGEAVKIMTGAPVPESADTIIEIENVESDGEHVFVKEAVKPYRNIIEKGEEVKAGDIAIFSGSLIRPVEVGILASLGYNKISVYKAPVIALIVTGDELVNIEAKIETGKIRNSNEYFLKAIMKNEGFEFISFGIVQDNKEVIKQKILVAMEIADIVVTSGGASKGDYDFVEDILVELGADIKFDSVAIKPGKPISFATIKDKLIFSLPGNPLAAITTFQEFIVPAGKKFMGKKSSVDIFPVILSDDYICKKGRKKYIYVNIQKVNGVYYGHKIKWQGSSGLVPISRANGIVIIPEGKEYVKSGEILNGYFIWK